MVDLQQENVSSGKESDVKQNDYFPMDKLPFDELLQRHPLLREKGWGLNEFTVFMKTGFINAEIREEDNVLLIDEESVFRLIDIHDEIINSRKVSLKAPERCS